MDNAYPYPDRVVYKYPLQYTAQPQKLHIIGANPVILHAQVDPKLEVPCIWIEHDIYGTSDAHVQLVGTGDTVPQYGNFLRTVEHRGFFWHIYAVKGW